MTLCYVDHTGFHHRRVYNLPWCRCGLNFNDNTSLQGHLETVSIGTTDHDVAEGEQ